MLHNYIIFLRSGDNSPTSRKTGLILFEDLLLAKGSKICDFLKSIEYGHVEVYNSFSTDLLLAKFLNRRIFSDFLENQIGYRDLMIYCRDVQEMWREKE